MDMLTDYYCSHRSRLEDLVSQRVVVLFMNRSSFKAAYTTYQKRWTYSGYMGSSKVEIYRGLTVEGLFKNYVHQEYL